MLSFRARFALAATAVSLISNLLCGAPALTTIQDVLYKADGTKFSGVLQITWTSFQAGDTSNIPTQSVTSEITNGYLHVLLVPTTNAATPAVYNVVYNSDGRVQFSEIWVVPPSTSPLRVSDVRTSRSAGNASALSQTQINDVSGLRTELNIRPTIGAGFAPSRAAVIDSNGGLTGASGNLSDCVHVDGSSGPCGTSGGTTTPPTPVTFSDAEIPLGPIDGVNPTFQLAGAPSPAVSLEIYRNGLDLQRNVDFTVSGSTITFQSGSVPQVGDALQAFYRTGSGTTSSAAFADAETPSGTVDGSNTAFGLLNTPTPVLSLALFRNGLAMQRNLDFTVTGAAINFQTWSVPQPGDILQAFYRAPGTSSTASFADAESPSGTIDGVNRVFGLANTPSPATSLELFRNGLALQRNVDFTLSGATLTFQSTSVPQPGDALEAFYRTAASGAAGALTALSAPTSVPSCTVYALSNNGSSWTTSVNGATAMAGPPLAYSTLQDVPLFALPSKGTITGIREKTTVAFSGAGFTAFSLWIGDTVGGPAFYTPASYDLTAAPGNTNFLSTQLFKSATDAGSTVIAHLSANAVLNSAPITGSVDIDVCWVTLP
jgi:hypothetical protein